MTLALLLVFQFQLAFAQSANISVAVDKPGADIPATLFGLFFEDINFGADGGLYPERVKNRSFEFPDALMSWKRSTQLELTAASRYVPILQSTRTTPITYESHRSRQRIGLAFPTKVFAAWVSKGCCLHLFFLRAPGKCSHRRRRVCAWNCRRKRKGNWYHSSAASFSCLEEVLRYCSSDRNEP